jgi:Xaa-Pro aminopeptidase
VDFSYLTVLPRGRQLWDYVVMPPEEYDARKAKIDKIFDKTGLDGLIVYSDAMSRRYINYLTNYTCSVAWSCAIMIVTRERLLRLVSSVAPRDINYNLKTLAPNIELNGIGLSLLTNYRVAHKTIEYLKSHNMSEMRWGGVNIDSLCYEGQKPIYEAYPDLPDCTPLYDEVLMQKTGAEQFAIAQAATIAKKAVLDYLRMAVPGANEREVAARVDRQCRVYGVGNIALLVSARKDGKLCLRQPEDYIIQEGDTVSAHVDINYLNYHGMFASSLYRGKPSDERNVFYKTVEEDYNKLLESIKSKKSIGGISFHNSSGYALAQGIGGDTTEAPYKDNDTPLENGTVFTLTLCRDDRQFGGVIISDTFKIDESGIHQLGGPGLDKLNFYA